MDGCGALTIGEFALSGIVALLGAFGGAWAAFRLERYQKSKDEKAANIAAANRALFTLYNMWNVLHQFDEEIIGPLRNSSDRWLNMPLTLPRRHGHTG